MRVFTCTANVVLESILLNKYFYFSEGKNNTEQNYSNREETIASVFVWRDWAGSKQGAFSTKKIKKNQSLELALIRAGWLFLKLFFI
jgi:hypothetical protein